MSYLKSKYCAYPDMHGSTYRLKPNRLTPIAIGAVRFILSAIIIAIFFGCNKDDGPQLPPKIQLLHQTGMISSDTTIAVGGLMTFAIAAESGTANLTNLIAQRNGTDEVVQRALDTSMNIVNFSIEKAFTKNLDEKEFWTFIIRDKNRLSDSVSLVISLDTTAGFGPIDYYKSLTLSAQNKLEPGSFFSFISGETYTTENAYQNQELIDLVYYFGEDDLTIGSPGANIENGIFENNPADWDVRRTTRFIGIDLPPEDFYSAENDSLLIASYTEGEGKRKAKYLSPGSTFSFQTQDLKYGIFRVTEIEGADAGTVKIDIKIQDKD